VCMFVCVCVCLCVYVCVCVCVRVITFLRVRACEHLKTNELLKFARHTHKHTHTHTHGHTHTRTRTHTRIHTHSYKYTHMHLELADGTRVCMCGQIPSGRQAVCFLARLAVHESFVYSASIITSVACNDSSQTVYEQ
jgi:ABC-type nickel/cobalt efflux system permease component RcnA